MATVVKVGERKDRRRAGNDGNTGQTWYERTWYVEFDAPAGGAQAATAFGVPQEFTVYSTSTEQDLTARVIRRTPKQLRNTDKAWEVVVRYETRSGSGGAGGVADKWEANPLMRPPRMTFHFEEDIKPVTGTLKDIVVTPDSTDIFEEPILNAVGMKFSPQPEVEDGTPILTITRNEASFDPAFAIEYNNTVNNDPFMGNAPRQLKLRVECPGGQTEMINQVEVVFYPVTYTMKGRREGWDLRNASRGTHHISTTTGSTKLEPFTDKSGNVIEGWLTSTGGATTAPTYQKDKHYREKPYANLNLPQQFI